MHLRVVAILGLVGCGSSDLNRHTRAFVAPTSCGQGPYEITLRADGTTGGDGVEIIACTPRRISGHVAFSDGDLELVTRSFGDVADNQRCLGGSPVIVARASSSAGAAGSASGGAGGTTGGANPMLIERPFSSSETPFSEELCGSLGLTAQEIMMPTILERTSLATGAVMRVWLWSDVPNDLDGVVFMIRQLTSKKTQAQVRKEEDKRIARHDTETPYTPPPRVEHGPPPPPLVEERSPQPVALATWVPGYWTWTGAQWGWIAGFWRDERYAPPTPQVELPGAPPRDNAIWIGGRWTLRTTGYVWIGGRWRR